MPLFGRKRKDEPEFVAEPPAPLAEPPEVDENGLRSMADHRDYLLSQVEELPPFGQQLLDAVGLSLCEDIVTTISLPGFDNSAMDGYAVMAEDVAAATEERPVTLPVVGEVAAGEAARHPLSPGTAMKIMTGAPLPEQADAVVPYESTDRGADDVRVYEPTARGRHIRRTGEDVAAGELVLGVGDRLDARRIGLLAAIGKDKVLVRPRPRVVVLATGSELVDPGLDLPSEQHIYDSNSFLLAAAAKSAGAQVFRVGLVGDDPAQVRQVISDQLIRADLLLTSGGVSQGDHDVIKQVMPELGSCDFAAVAMQPGKPQGFGLIGDDRTPMIMVPGNPVSAFVSFETFVRPVIRKLMGVTPYTRPVLRCRAAKPIHASFGRMNFARGVVSVDVDGGYQVELAGGHGSHLIGDLSRANALVIIPREVEEIPAGHEVDVWLLDDDQ